jgi:hypothetical protein
MTTPEQKVERAAFRSVSARSALHLAIREARAEGLPLRTIAKAAGLSPEWVRRISSGLGCARATPR